MPALLTPAEAIAVLRCSRRTLRRLTGRRDLPVVLVGTQHRFRAEDLEAYIEARRNPAGMQPRPRRLSVLA